MTMMTTKKKSENPNISLVESVISSINNLTGIPKKEEYLQELIKKVNQSDHPDRNYIASLLEGIKDYGLEPKEAKDLLKRVSMLYF